MKDGKKLWKKRNVIIYAHNSAAFDTIITMSTQTGLKYNSLIEANGRILSLKL